MNKIVINLEYGCYPVWLYNDLDELILNDLPWELSDELDIDASFLEIQGIFDSHFSSGINGMDYCGFESESEKGEFLDMIDNAIHLIKMRIANLYSIEKKFDL